MLIFSFCYTNMLIFLIRDERTFESQSKKIFIFNVEHTLNTITSDQGNIWEWEKKKIENILNKKIINWLETIQIYKMVFFFFYNIQIYKMLIIYPSTLHNNFKDRKKKKNIKNKNKIKTFLLHIFCLPFDKKA